MQRILQDPGWFIAGWCEFNASESCFHGPWGVWLALVEDRGKYHNYHLLCILRDSCSLKSFHTCHFLLFSPQSWKSCSQLASIWGIWGSKKWSDFSKLKPQLKMVNLAFALQSFLFFFFFVFENLLTWFPIYKAFLLASLCLVMGTHVGVISESSSPGSPPSNLEA